MPREHRWDFSQVLVLTGHSIKAEGKNPGQTPHYEGKSWG